MNYFTAITSLHQQISQTFTVSQLKDDAMADIAQSIQESVARDNENNSYNPLNLKRGLLQKAKNKMQNGLAEFDRATCEQEVQILGAIKENQIKSIVAKLLGLAFVGVAIGLACVINKDGKILMPVVGVVFAVAFSHTFVVYGKNVGDRTDPDKFIGAFVSNATNGMKNRLKAVSKPSDGNLNLSLNQKIQILNMADNDFKNTIVSPIAKAFVQYS